MSELEDKVASTVEEYISKNAILDSDDKVVVKELWDRVNICKYNPNRITQSFFVRVSESGIECNPSIGA
jgi:hypothetical protein